MGGSESRATTVVNAEINSALSVLQKAISSAQSSVVNINEIIIGPGCKLGNLDEINMSNFATVNLKTVQQSVMDAQFTQDVQQAVKQAADSAAKAGIGIAASESDAITRSITNISAAVTHAIQNVMQSDIVNENFLQCYGDAGDLRLINMTNKANATLDAVTSSQEVVAAKQSAVLDIAQEIKSLASGMDPTALVGIIVVVLVVVLGAGLFGANKVLNLVTSTQFWFLVSLLGMLGGSGVALLRIPKTWPYGKDADKNKTILAVAGIAAGMGLLGTVITGAMMKRRTATEA